MSTERIPVGIVGGGQVGVDFATFLSHQRNVRIAGIVTSTPARQEELARRFHTQAVGTVEELMALPDRPHVVCVVNANDRHCQAAVTALEGGAHVYLEKPMAPTLDECVTIVETEKRTGKCVQVGFEYIHGTMTTRLKELVDQGYFGDVVWASVVDSRGHWWAIDPHADRDEIWKLDRKRGGGIIFHCGIHQLDCIRHYLGPIEEITAYVPPRNPLSFYPGDVPGNVTLMLRAASGAVCNFQVFHDRAPTYYRETNGFKPDWRTTPGHEFDISLVGTAGSCQCRIYAEQMHLFRFDHEQKDTVFDRTEVFSPNAPDRSHHDMKGLLRRFLQAVSNGGGAIDPAEGHLETMRLAFAAEDAITKGGTVHLSDYR